MIHQKEEKEIESAKKIKNFVLVIIMLKNEGKQRWKYVI